ncbi:MAG: 5'-Nucleotidase domain protein, partial [Bacteroidetes bacterium]|nr:5'-Nucleotidase domain protein [Bacteroidota bacterium]
GLNWNAANNGIANTSIIGIAALDTTIICISNQSRAFRSSDHGAIWSEQSFPPFVTRVAALRGLFFVGTSFDLYGTVYRSADDGNSWQSVLAAGGVYSIGGSDRNVFAGTSGFGGYGVYRSTNGGSAWTFVPSLFARAFTVFDSILFAGNNRSTDNGITWTPMNLPSQVLAYGIHSSILFAGTENSGAFRSTDLGVTWTNVGFQSNRVDGFVSMGQSLFAAASASVYRTTNNGVSWTPVNQGLPNAISIAANRTHLFAGTSVSGVWRRPLSQIVVGVGSENITNVPHKRSLDQNYPNPFNPSTKIQFQVPSSAFVELKVYDVLGREVATLLNEVLTPGSYEATFDASSLAGGVYFYRLTTSSFSATRKLLLLK